VFLSTFLLLLILLLFLLLLLLSRTSGIHNQSGSCIPAQFTFGTLIACMSASIMTFTILPDQRVSLSSLDRCKREIRLSMLRVLAQSSPRISSSKAQGLLYTVTFQRVLSLSTNFDLIKFTERFPDPISAGNCAGCANELHFVLLRLQLAKSVARTGWSLP